jgi:hypothetical protein
MIQTALAPRAAPSLYSGMILALIALAFALQASFLAGLARGGAGGFAARPPAGPPVIARSSTPASPAPCAIP